MFGLMPALLSRLGRLAENPSLFACAGMGAEAGIQDTSGEILYPQYMKKTRDCTRVFCYYNLK